MSESEWFYGIEYEDQLLTLEKESNQGRHSCGEYRYTFSVYKGYPLYKTKELKEAKKALIFDTPWYNSSDYEPSHGSIDITQCKIVKVELITLIEEVEYTLPKTLELLAKDNYRCFNAGGEMLKELRVTKDQTIVLVNEGYEQCPYKTGEHLHRDSFYDEELITKIVYPLPEFFLKDYPKGYAIVLNKLEETT